MQIGHIVNLYKDTKCRLQDARQKCRAGKKDEARDTLRSIRNASIIQIIKDAPIEKYEGIQFNWPLLQWELNDLVNELEKDVHPTATFAAQCA